MTVPNIDYAEFLRESVVDVDAAVVGIGKNNWIGLPGEEATEERAAAMMKEHRFDVLPIIDGNEVKRYFRAKTWNCYSSVLLEYITYKQVIPYRTHIRDVIKGFAVDGRNFYFLAHERRINGLITIANLNCRQVTVYLFNLITEFEVSLARLITQTPRVSEDELLTMSLGCEGEQSKSRYRKDREKGIELPFVEYLCLSTLINIMIKKSLYEALEYSRTRFEKNFGSLNDLRNSVAHPVASLVSNHASIERLWRRIDRIEEALFKLRVT